MGLFGDNFKKKVVLNDSDFDEVSRKKYKLKDFLLDLNEKHGNILKQDPDAVKDFQPFIVLRSLSQHTDCVLWCDEINRRPNMSKEMMYTYLYSKIRKSKRYSSWTQPYSNEDIDLIKEYYKYSNERAIEAYEKVLSKKPNALSIIRQKLDKGGRK